MSLARTANGVVSREEDDNLVLPVVVLPESRLARSGRSGRYSSSGDLDGVVGAAAKAVWSCSPLRSSSYLVCARKRRYGSGTARCAAKPAPVYVELQVSLKFRKDKALTHSQDQHYRMLCSE